MSLCTWLAELGPESETQLPAAWAQSCPLATVAEYGAPEDVPLP